MSLTREEVAGLRSIATRTALVSKRELLALLDAHDEAERLRAELDEARGYTREPGVVNYRTIRDALAPLSGRDAMAEVTLEHVSAIADRVAGAERERDALRAELAALRAERDVARPARVEEVVGCASCHSRVEEWGRIEGRCARADRRFTGSEADSLGDSGEAAEWCPLRERPTLVRLRARGAAHDE